LSRRSDDTEDALDKRLDQYRELTTPVADHYASAHLLKKVNVMPGRDAVFQTLYSDMKEAA
jgi:adenylate kinase family enzyme